jgi:hypothetical protein
MKKLLIITLLFSNFPSFSFDDGSDKIIKKYLKAIGGAKEWEAVNTIKIAMHEDNKTLGEIFTIISILREKGYRKERSYTMELKYFRGGTPSADGYFNEVAWSVINLPFSQVEDKKKDSTIKANHKKWGFNQVKDLSNDKLWIQPLKWQTQMPWCFIDYEPKGYKTTYKGDSKISVDEVSEIEMISPTGDTASYFFNKKSSLLLKAAYKKREYVYSTYKQVNNVKVPFEMTESRIDFNGKGVPYTLWYTIDQVKLNEPMDEKIFMKPKQ